MDLPKQISQKSEYNAWASMLYWSSLSGLFVPFFNIILPLILWFQKKGQSEFLDQHAKSLINFQISMSIAIIIFVLVGLGCKALGGFFILFYMSICFFVSLLLLYAIGVIIMGAHAAKSGEPYAVFLSMRFIK